MTVGETTKKYLVLVSRYPEKYYIDASNEDEAREKVLSQVNFSVWETLVEEEVN